MTGKIPTLAEYHMAKIESEKNEQRMSLFLAEVLYRLLHQCIYLVKSRGSPADSRILDNLLAVEDEILIRYPSLKQLKESLEGVVK